MWKKGPLSPDEDVILSQLVAKFGARNWSLIARDIPGRSGKSFRIRWCNQLDPAVKRKPFTGTLPLTFEASTESSCSLPTSSPEQEAFILENVWHLNYAKSCPNLHVLQKIEATIMHEDYCYKKEGNAHCGREMGCEVIQVDNTDVKCLAPCMTKFMKLLTFVLKIGAHLAAGMGEMMPDLSKEVGHMVGSLMLTGAVGANAVGSSGNRARLNPWNIQQEQMAAHQ